MTWRVVGEPVQGQAHGLVHDVDDAVSFAVAELEMTVLESRTPAPGTREYELLGPLDEPGLVRVEGLGEVDPALPRAAGSRTLTITAAIGRIGEPERERRLIELFHDRLQQLAGDPLGRRRHPRPER